MANLDLTTIGLIVEKNMRDIGLYKDDLESGWKSTILGSDDVTYTLKTNMKNFRDMIAQSIIDAITLITASGTLSTGNTPGNPVKAGSNSQVSINGKLMSGIGDSVSITFPPGTIIVVGGTGPSSNVIPITATGQITSGG